jgi:hypothetical protein
VFLTQGRGEAQPAVAAGADDGGVGGAGSDVVDDVDCIRAYVCYLCPRVASARRLSAYAGFRGPAHTCQNIISWDSIGPANKRYIN